MSQTVFRALLDAAGPTGTIQISFRIFPEHVEVDVLHSHAGLAGEPTLAQMIDQSQAARAAVERRPGGVVRRLDDGRAARGGPHPGGGGQAARCVGVSVNRWVGGETEPQLRDPRRIQERVGDHPLS
ncbi:MAG TPA: hypothetical protein VFX16_24145 [Pseudonocardiaceae bacterium]|nr:hypothetical protein [Pseudonocardiaceae bacterium]